MKRLVMALRSYPSRPVIIGLLGLLFLMGAVGCAASAPAEQAAVAPANSSGAIAPAAPEASRDLASGSEGIDEDVLANADKQEASRVIIYTANMTLVVQDTRAAEAAITSLAAEQGGYVSGSNIYQVDDVPRGQITIRIPAENYQATMTKLRELAVRVDSETANTQDVTEEYTDLEARKTNLEYTEQALQKLLEERQRVGSTSDILEVYRELTNVRGQIEQIEGRMRYLATQAALSTITVDLVPDVIYQPVSVGGWEPRGVAKEALQALIAALQGLTNVAIWLVIFIVPLLIALLIPVVIFVWLVRWWWKRYKASKGTPPAPPAAGTSEA